MSNAPVQTTISYTVNGDTVKVVRWDVEYSVEQTDRIRQEYRELSDDDYAHVRQDEIRSTADVARYCDGHFFDLDTMRAFSSRVGRERLVNGALYFVTSEKMSPFYNFRTGETHTYPRLYSVRVFRDGRIDEAEGTELGQFKTSKAANKFLDSIGKD